MANDNGGPVAVGKSPPRRSGGLRYLIDNLPYAATAALGAWVLLPIHWSLSVLEVLAAILGPLWIILSVCPNCVLYGSGGCPSGFGLVSSRLTQMGDPEGFRDAFSRHIAAVFPMWFLPIGGAIYIVLTGGMPALLPLVAFILVAFVVVPVKARYWTCRKCAKRADCPWGSRTVAR